MAQYVNNKRLKEVLKLYNTMNINDTGDWCPEYLVRQEKKYLLGKMSKDDWEQCKEFIHKRVKAIEELQERYAKFTPEERRAFDKEFDKIKNELCDMIVLMAIGRINSFGLRNQLKNPDDIQDIQQDAVINAFRYLNRFDENRGTSAFAYVTQQITNSIVLNLKKIKDHENTYLSGCDWFDNINTVDDPRDGVSGLANFIE